MIRSVFWKKLVGSIALAGLIVATTEADERVDFEQHIAPILENKCLRCHSPGISKGDVSLATITSLHENEYVVVGKPDESYLLDLVTPEDGEAQMPKDGDPLDADSIALLRRWIEQGAAWPENRVLREPSKGDRSWWSLQPLSDAEPPNISEMKGIAPEWTKSPIDRFVVAKLVESGLLPNPPADRGTLIRRATFDLLGLPPRPEDIEAFVNDKKPGAYPRLVDRLLASPHYGERWGRHWLDVVRFGESVGFEQNFLVENLWPFRDYVIRSINEDKPFDQFIREHLAGDVIDGGRPETKIGSAFLVAGPYDTVNNQDAVMAAQIRANTIDEIVRATSGAFLGLTVGCARCHDHKFDPILQSDYYQLYATFAGIKHGSDTLASQEERANRTERVKPLLAEKKRLEQEKTQLEAAITSRANENAAKHAQSWTRPRVDRTGTTDTFEAVKARFVRFTCDARERKLDNGNGFRIDEFEVWSTGENPRNVALADNGGRATGASRDIEDFPGAYGPHLTIDGKTGARFIAKGNTLQIEFAQPEIVNRVVFSSARGEEVSSHPTFEFVAEYRIEVSLDGESWTEVAHGRDRQPINDVHRAHRLRRAETTAEERDRLASLDQKIRGVTRKIAAVPALRTAWTGRRDAPGGDGPFRIFIGGNPQRPAEEVVAASLSTLSESAPEYRLAADASESKRRRALADWIVNPDNPLTPRVLVNRLWHYHFGTGIVDTPNDLGYMGGQPTHPELLDWLTRRLLDEGWQIKPLHRLIMLSQTYRQSSEHRPKAASVDGDSRLLWRFPPRRLSAEEIRDTMLVAGGKLEQVTSSSSASPPDSGPGFRLYQFLRDNVSTYVPLDNHGPETYRRAVFHQNARAAPVDLMTDFDQPDCALSAPRRASTTTPLQALTSLNHQFTLDMANAMAERLKREADDDSTAQIQRAYVICYGRAATPDEISLCRDFIEKHSLAALCRAILNTSELIYVR